MVFLKNIVLLVLVSWGTMCLFFRCEHDKRKSAVDCMIDVIGENNSEHFFVATQDAELRKKFQEVCPNVLF